MRHPRSPSGASGSRAATSRWWLKVRFSRRRENSTRLATHAATRSISTAYPVGIAAVLGVDRDTVRADLQAVAENPPVDGGQMAEMAENPPPAPAVSAIAASRKAGEDN